ncbi:alpha/beta hydrolase [Leifsonia poae]|uniref:Esterase n=1 Tax=Leifsonia poae TaxID=110933 RepID=A0A9W6LZC9_9MICO|nr:alpha/beta hydrolase-fold protein [Leifsonia poae]GLJ75512.1 esterase [Leifsonia poae]
MLDALWRTDIVEGPVIYLVFSLAAAGAVFLLLRRPTPRWLLTVAIALGAGLVAAVVTWFVAIRTLNLFGMGLGMRNYVWIAATFCGVFLAVASLWRSRWWRTLVAAVCIPLFAIAGTVAINADYGLDRTLGSLVGVPTDPTIQLAGTTATSDLSTLWKTWKAPADMPATGRAGVQVIPNTRSGFHARPAGIYLPPAALVENPPRLPLLVMMMGQPGHPDPGLIASILDPIAARHHGLAPIVVMPDQLGEPTQDPLCLNTARYGDAQTYLARDVPDWALKHLNISRDHREWTVAGFSNGGECALALTVTYPTLFGNLIDLAGEAFPAAEVPGPVLANVFHGDQSAYDRIKPLNMMAGKRYSRINAVFAVGQFDPYYPPISHRMAQAARAHGMRVWDEVVPGADHSAATVIDGLPVGLRDLYPSLGLSAPDAG